MAINHVEPWRPKKMNPQNPFLSSKRSSDASAFAEKEKHLASTEKHRRSIFSKTKELQEETLWRHTHEMTPQHHQPKPSTK
jgi:hypothetical protein